jgi:hypothetical protein
MFVLLVIFFVYSFSIDDIQNDMTKLDNYSGYVVTDMKDDYLIGNLITLRKDSLHYKFTSDDIIFEQFSVGDTLK